MSYQARGCQIFCAHTSVRPFLIWKSHKVQWKIKSSSDGGGRMDEPRGERYVPDSRQDRKKYIAGLKLDRIMTNEVHYFYTGVNQNFITGLLVFNTHLFSSAKIKHWNRQTPWGQIVLEHFPKESSMYVLITWAKINKPWTFLKWRFNLSKCAPCVYVCRPREHRKEVHYWQVERQPTSKIFHRLQNLSGQGKNEKP